MCGGDDRLPLPPPSTGCRAGDAFEYAGQVALIGKSALLGDVGNGCLGEDHQQVLRPINPLFQQPLMGRHPGTLLESAGEMAGGHAALPRQIGDHMIGCQIAHHCQCPAQLPGCEPAALR